MLSRCGRFGNCYLRWRPIQERAGRARRQTRVRESTLETVAIDSGLRTIIYRAKEHFEAPNWSSDGRTFFFNRGGRIYSIPVRGGTPVRLDTGTADRCNNDHGLSPDGRWLAISHTDPAMRQSVISVLPSQGGTPKRVTPLGPSYWHGWSPDGQTLAYCAERNGEFDIYTIADQAAKRNGSQPPTAWTTAPTTRLTASTFISTPNEPA